MSENKRTLNSILSAGELSLKDLFLLVWEKRKFVYITVIVFLILGIIAAKTSPKEYEAKCTVLSDQASSGASSSLQALSALAGIPSSGSSDGGSSADLYPYILSNQPFLLELGKDTVLLEDGKSKIVLQEYFQNRGDKSNAVVAFKNMIFGLPATIIGLFRSQSPDHVTASSSVQDKNAAVAQPTNTGKGFSSTASIIDLQGKDQSIINIMKSRIKMLQSGRQITLSVKMPEARLSAEVTKMVLNKMIRYATEYKTGKQLETLRFLEQRTAEAEQRYKADQLNLAGFKDNNYGVIFQSVQSKELQLQNEFSLSFSLYNQLVTQLEQARIQLKKDTPLFTVLEPVYVPTGVSEPQESKIIFMYLIIGFVVGFGIVIFTVIRSFLAV